MKSDEVMKMPKTNSDSGYNRARLAAILCLLAANSSCAVISTVHNQYPLGVAPILFLLPCLLREFDLRSGRPLRRLSSFEWSCFLAGIFFLAVLPFLLLS